MPTVHKLAVSKLEEAQRLDIYLASKLGFSRSFVKNLLDEGRVRVNGKAAKPSHKIKEDDSVEVEVPEPRPVLALPEAIPIEVLYEDEDIIVVNKPPGLSVHPGAGRTSGTLVNALLYHAKKLSQLGGPLRPGIVHRLDKDTSGSIVAAKNDPSYISLTRQFKEHTSGRTYTALVWGMVRDNEGTIDLKLGRDTVERKKISTRARKKRAAITHYRVLRRYPYLTLLELRLKTGRTHQIRVHLNAINHPVVGDQVYGKRSVPPSITGPLAAHLKGIKRQMLHARTLGITHPAKGSYMEFTAPMPKDMAVLIRLLEVSQKP